MYPKDKNDPMQDQGTTKQDGASIKDQVSLSLSVIIPILQLDGNQPVSDTISYQNIPIKKSVLNRNQLQFKRSWVRWVC